MTQQVQTDRNEQIRELHAAGVKISNLARRFNLSRQRVDQIVKPSHARARAMAAQKMNNEHHPCEVCGAPNAMKHHDNYEEPLNIRWLCQKCHLVEHVSGNGNTVSINITLYPEDLTVIDQVAKAYGHETRSSTIRFIIRDWARMRAQAEKREQKDGGAR